LNEVKCPPGCVPATQKDSLLSKCSTEPYDCEEGEAKIKSAFAKWDDCPTTAPPIDCEAPDDFCTKFNTSTPDKCPSFEKAAADKCPELVKKVKTKEDTLRLLKEGKPQCDLSCFKDLSAQANRESANWLHQNTCDCPTCSISRLLQSGDDLKDDEEDDEGYDPCRCRECGALLDEDGKPIEDDDEEDDIEADPCDSDPEKDKCYSKKFDLDESGKPIYEGGMCMERSKTFLWKHSEPSCDDENSMRSYRRATEFNGFPTKDGEERVPYVGGADMEGAERFLWNRPPPEPEAPPEPKKCLKKKKKCAPKKTEAED
jgi:hypothetical protein